MLYYKSSLGCVEYYDDVLYEPRLCDPTMLFILGLEAVTTPQKEYYKEIPVIDPDTHKPVIDPDTGLPVTETVIDGIRLRHVVIYKDRVNNEDVYNKIIKYFSIHGETKEFEDHVEFYCAGLRQFMNQLTGTDSSRIVPVIFHDIIEFSTLGVENDSDYNEIYEKITNVLNNAGCKNQTYKKLDNKAMYSYALGVLFGCQCSGYDEYLIYRDDPASWYDGDYTNLVSSAFASFKYHHYKTLCCIDIDPKLKFKYHGIQANKLWNFRDEPFYDIIIEDADHGYITASKERSSANRVIEVEAYPDKQFLLDHISVLCEDTPVSVDDLSFVMPDGDVSVYPFFIEKPIETPSGGTIGIGEHVSSGSEVTIEYTSLHLDTKPDYRYSFLASDFELIGGSNDASLDKAPDYRYSKELDEFVPLDSGTVAPFIRTKAGYYKDGSTGWLYSDEQCTVPVYYDSSITRTPVSVIEYIDERWGGGTIIHDASQCSLSWYQPSRMIIMPHFDTNITNYGFVVIEYTES